MKTITTNSKGETIKWYISYDPHWDKVSTIDIEDNDQRHVKTNYLYDWRGQVQEAIRTDPSGSDTVDIKITFSDAGVVNSMTDAQGRTVELEFEGAKMVRAVIPGPHKKVYKLTQYGKAVRFSDKDSRSEEAHFVARLLSQLEEVLDNLKVVQSIQKSSIR